MLCEYIHCRRVVGAVTRVQGLHLGHEVEEEATHPLLTLWKPEEKMKEMDVERFAYLHNDACSAAFPSLQSGCNTAGRTLDVPALTAKQCCSELGGGHLLGALFQRLDQHLLEGADLLQVSQNEGHIRAAQSETRRVRSLVKRHAVLKLAQWSLNSNVWSDRFVLVSALKSSQVICQEALKIL